MDEWAGSGSTGGPLVHEGRGNELFNKVKDLLPTCSLSVVRLTLGSAVSVHFFKGTLRELSRGVGGRRQYFFCLGNKRSLTKVVTGLWW